MTIAETEMVAVTSDVPVLVAVNVAIFPEPALANPILELVFVQEKVAPVGSLVNAVVGTVPLWQTVMFAGTVVIGDGLTEIV